MIIRRETVNGANDLKTVYRPCTVDEFIGNEVGKKIIKNSLDTQDVSHAYLFTGSAGCGKTSMARIIALGLNCEVRGVSSEPCLECGTCKRILEGNHTDVKEINVGQANGKDHTEKVIQDLSYAPFDARYKVIIFDEAHKLTTAAKDLLLKPLENGYSHVYFIFCTNQPDQLKAKNKKKGEPFLDRLFTLNFNEVEREDIYSLVLNICEFEGLRYSKDVLNIITDESAGIPRLAINWLDSIIKEGSWHLDVAKQICLEVDVDEDPNIYELSRALNSGNFKAALDKYELVKKIPAETLRIVVSGFFVGCLKKSQSAARARMYSALLDILADPIYEVGKPGMYKWTNCMFKITDTIKKGSKK